MTHKLGVVAASFVTLLSTAASASPSSEMCDAMNKSSSPEKKWAYSTLLWSDAWKESFEDGCSVDADNEVSDRLDHPQIVYVAQIIRAFGGVSGKEVETFTNGSTAAYAIARLDKKQFDDDIKSLPAFNKKLLTRAWDFAMGEVNAYDAWRAEQAKSPAGKKVWKDGYQTVIDTALARYNKEAADIAFGLEAIQAATEGRACPDVLGRFHALIAKEAPKTLDATRTFMDTSMAAEVLWDAVGQCALAADHDEVGRLAVEVGGAFNHERHVLGPSARIANALHDLYEQATRKTRGGVAEPRKGGGGSMVALTLTPDYNAKLTLAKADINPSLTRYAYWGVIATKKAKGKDYVEITFKKKMERSWISSCTRTNRISKVDENGNVDYEQDCSMYKGKSQDVSPYPVKVPVELAKNLKAGQLLFFAELSDNQYDAKATRIGMPVEVYKSDKANAPLVGLLGAGW